METSIEAPSYPQTVLEIASRFPEAEDIIPVESSGESSHAGGSSSQTTGSARSTPIVFLGPDGQVCGVPCNDIMTSNDPGMYNGHEQMSVFNTASIRICIKACPVILWRTTVQLTEFSVAGLCCVGWRNSRAL